MSKPHKCGRFCTAHKTDQRSSCDWDFIARVPRGSDAQWAKVRVVPRGRSRVYTGAHNTSECLCSVR